MPLPNLLFLNPFLDGSFFAAFEAAIVQSFPRVTRNHLILPVQLHRKLELARVVGSGGLTGVGKERAYGRGVISIRDVEHIGNQLQADALAEVDAPGDAKVVEDRPGGRAGIAAEVAVEGLQGDERETCLRRGGGREGLITRFLENAGRRIL